MVSEGDTGKKRGENRESIWGLSQLLRVAGSHRVKRLAFGLAGEKLHAVQNCGDHEFCLKASRKKKGRDRFLFFSLQDKMEDSLHKPHTSDNKTCLCASHWHYFFSAISNNSLMAGLIVMKWRVQELESSTSSVTGPHTQRFITVKGKVHV